MHLDSSVDELHQGTRSNTVLVIDRAQCFFEILLTYSGHHALCASSCVLRAYQLMKF